VKINIEINDELMTRAQELSGLKDKSALINKALELFITIENQTKLLDLRGKIEFDDAAFE
jgi:Arc/MetJ family transcription regulator